MQFYGKASEAASQILAAFQSGDLPAALAPAFIRRRDDTPCRKWSWNNQLITAIRGHSDARGYRQWGEVGRHVKKGEKGFAILAPCLKKVEGTDPATGQPAERMALVGFRHAIVFGLSQTDGAPLVETDPEVRAWFDSLPLLDVARSWGLSVELFNGHDGGPLGKYCRGRSIALGVRNLSTWAHELIHAADDKLGTLVERGQHWRSEVVAELGGAILLEALGLPGDSDRGGCWHYVSAYARDAELEPIVACQRVLKRACDAVALVLDTADALQGNGAGQSASTPEVELAAVA